MSADLEKPVSLACSQDVRSPILAARLDVAYRRRAGRSVVPERAPVLRFLAVAGARSEQRDPCASLETAAVSARM